MISLKEDNVMLQPALIIGTFAAELYIVKFYQMVSIEKVTGLNRQVVSRDAVISKLYL